MGVSGSILVIVGSLLATTYEEKTLYRNAEIRRDYTATVISEGSGMSKRLLVNGVGITHLTPITKIMGHMPLFFLERKPESAIVICFGMGTTFRSAMRWNIVVRAIELIPSVRESFGYYFDDARSLLKHSKGKVVIDDGRRYLMRTNETYDVVTIDPPPHVTAAGSSLLYSVEFYELIKTRLNQSGIVHQWCPAGEGRVLEAVLRSLVLSFPYVKVFRSIENWGFHFLASMSPITIPSVQAAISRMPQAARKDLMEWYPKRTMEDVIADIVSREMNSDHILNKDKSIYISDDRPYNEYFLVRQVLSRFLKKART
jgi:spermidine synthase